MDALPNEPPAHVASEHQAAIDALARLAATQKALATLVAEAPSPEASGTTDVRGLAESLTAFWEGATPTGKRSERLAGLVADAMRDDALLRARDGTFDGRAAQVIGRAMRVGQPATPGVHARELIFGDQPYAGALIFQDDAAPDQALLFTPHGGWEAYDSLEHLLHAARRRWLDPLDAADATAMGSDELARARQLGTVGSREITGDVPTALARQLIATQVRRVALAIDDMDLDGVDDPTAMMDPLRRILSADSLLDIDAITRLRTSRLVEAAAQARLALVPAHVRDAWIDARAAYEETLAAATDLRVDLALGPPLSLREFAERALNRALADLGVTTPAQAISVEITGLPDTTQPLEVIGGMVQPKDPRRVSLVELGYESVGHLSRLRAVGPDGLSLDTSFDEPTIRSTIRRLDLPNAYQAHVESSLRTGQGSVARSISLALQRDRMRLDAADARLGYYLPGGTPSFIDDHGERGFRLVEAALDALVPTGRRTVDGHQVAVRQLTYKGSPVADLLLFSVRSVESAPRIVAYTPHAPDGRVFREFEDRQHAGRDFLYHPAFREYLLDRLPAEYARRLPNGQSREFAGDHRSHWVLGAADASAYTLTDEPFEERVVEGDFLLAAYDAAVDLVNRDARFVARDAAAADHAELSTLPGFNGRFDTGLSLVADGLAEIPKSAVRTLQASWRFYDEVKAGDMGAAIISLAEGYNHALNLAVPPFTGARSLARSMVRSRSSVAGLVDTGARTTRTAAVFETRYKAKTPRTPGTPDSEGIYRVKGGTFIRHDGNFYAVHYHRDYATWRLARADGARSHPDMTGPAIEWIDGQWQFNHDVGLRGGMRRVRERFRRVLRLGGDGPVPNPPPAAGAVRPVPRAAPPYPPLPPSLEPMREEIVAAARANPSARFLYRQNATHGHFDVRTRSALIRDPNLAPDISALSPHQRRVFLHELEARFPQVAERAEVLNARGWTRHEGRRDAVVSPGGQHGLDDAGQSTAISSTADPAPPPVPQLSPDQATRWNEALVAAARAPETAPAANSLGAVDMLPPGEMVPINEWPARLWLFSEQRPRMDAWSPYGPGLPILTDAAPGTRRVLPTTTMPPETPIARLSDTLGVSLPQTGQPDAFRHWIGIDLEGVRLNAGGDATRTGFELWRHALPSGEFRYTMESVRPVTIPATLVRTGRLTPRPGEERFRVPQLLP